ncbi:uncharacterized protein LOC124149395 [Haliotis rufescens]|uniref:uncharacterized protein LOC124149395 n=1 Tax=Haliotis rufescens TaxID=6454 RepID=UPI00201F7CA0|nr:uncharacterized protein LOC124149395 [Haliotis rufescens]
MSLGRVNQRAKLPRLKAVLLEQVFCALSRILPHLMMNGHISKIIMKISMAAFLLLLECHMVICQEDALEECKTTFNLAKVNDSFSDEDIFSVVNNSELPDCVSRCYRHTRCVGVRFAPSTGQCHMYAAYQTQSTGTGTSGDKYYIMKPKCGSPNSTKPYVYRRQDIITTTYLCDDGKAFLGTNDTLLCVYPSYVWTTESGTCIGEAAPIRFDGSYLHPLNSSFSFTGTPTGSGFEVVFVTPSSDYPLKIYVNIPQQSVFRQIYNASIWYPGEGDLDSPFPFDLGSKFTMEIISTALEFQCKVNGEMLFTFLHRLPRDSVQSIKFFSSVIGERILLKPNIQN